MTNEELVLSIRSAGATEKKELLAELYRQNGGLIYQMARKYARGCIEVDDLMQESFFGLYEAASTFNADKGSFTTWLHIYLQKVFSRAVHSTSTTVRIPVYRRQQVIQYRKEAERFYQMHGREPLAAEMCGVLGVGLDEVEEIRTFAVNESSISLDAPRATDEQGRTVDLMDILPDPRDRIGESIDSVFAAEMKRDIWRAVDALEDKSDREIIRAFYKDGLSAEDVGRIRGIPRQAAHECRNKALNHLRRHPRARALKSYFDYYTTALHGTGLSAYQHTLTSATENAALKHLRLIERHAV